VPDALVSVGGLLAETNVRIAPSSAQTVECQVQTDPSPNTSRMNGTTARRSPHWLHARALRLVRFHSLEHPHAGQWQRRAGRGEHRLERHLLEPMVAPARITAPERAICAPSTSERESQQPPRQVRCSSRAQ
jgi:hypothetical protein